MSLAPRKDAQSADAASERLPRLRQRQRLIDACISALNTHGPSRITVEKVVAIAGLSPGTVSFYFDSKAAMLVAALEHLASEFERQVMAPVLALADRPVLALQTLVELMTDAEIASGRKVSVWYAFWGEATSRQEYSAICGRRDAEFGAMVQRLVERLIADTGAVQLDAEGVALGLVGALEIVWQSLAFEEEAENDRAVWKARCIAYLRSVFPHVFDAGAAAPARPSPAIAYDDPAQFERERARLVRPAWSVVAHEQDLRRPGDFVSGVFGGDRVLVVRDANLILHAVRNECRRRPHALVTEPAGRFDGTIHCAADGSVYGLDGAGLDPLDLAQSGGLVYVRAANDGLRRPPALEAMHPAGATQAIELSADWKVVVEQWLDEADRAGCEIDRDARSVLWSDGRVKRRFLFPHLLLETEGGARRLLQIEPIAAGKCRLDGRAYVYHANESTAVAWPPLDRVAALAVSTQIGLTAPSYRVEGAETPPIAALHAWLGATLGGR